MIEQMSVIIPDIEIFEASVSAVFSDHIPLDFTKKEGAQWFERYVQDDMNAMYLGWLIHRMYQRTIKEDQE